MKNSISYTLFLVFNILFLNLYSQNCPQYSNTSSGAMKACGNQDYTLIVENTGCNGLITFQVVGNYGSNGSAITWSVESNLSGQIVASGGPGTNNQAINVTVGPLDPNVHGNVFDLKAQSSSGNGFTGGGFIQTEQNGNMLTSISSAFTSSAHSMFNANIAISSSTITIETPSGNITKTVRNCNDIIALVPLDNSNFCTPINVTLPWTIKCDVTNATIASGTQTLTIYPKVPTGASDLVDIDWNAATCSWDVSPQNDCELLDIGTVFTISPNPTTMNIDACEVGSQEFTVDYIGGTDAPDCCATGGPLEEVTYNVEYSASNGSVVNSPYGGSNNSAAFTIPPNLSGGNGTSLELCIEMTNFCFYPPNDYPDQSYFVTVYVDGLEVLFDPSLTGPTYNNCIDLNSIPGGYNQSSEIEIFIFPNVFSYSPIPIFVPSVNTRYAPNKNCGNLSNGEWRANFNITLEVEFDEMAGTPVDCSFPLSVEKTCCTNIELIAQNPSTITVQCAFDVPDPNVAVVNDIVSECVIPPTVTFLNEVSDGNTCNGEQITRTYRVEDACGNQTEAIQIIVIDEVPPAYTLQGDDPTTCQGTDGKIVVEGLEPNTEYELTYTYAQDGSTVGPITITTNAAGEYTISDLLPGDYVDFRIRLMSCLNCAGVNAAGAHVGTGGAPEIGAGEDRSICEGESITLTANNPDGALITWSNNVLDGQSFVPPVGVHTYVVTGELNDCESQDEVVITVNPTPIIDIDSDNLLICKGEEVRLTASGANTLVWSDGIVNNQAFEPPVGTHVYTATGTSDFGCSATNTVTVVVSPLPNANFSINPNTLGSISSEINFSNHTTGANSFEWFFGDGTYSNEINPSHEYDLSEDEYTVYLVATSGPGCIDTVAITIQVVEDLIYYIPNSFTPNDDDYNDEFRPVFTDGFDPLDYHLMIFNRWGEVVFESYDVNYGWDGTYGQVENIKVPEGIYIWKITVKTTSSDERAKFVGHVTLMR